MACREGGRGEGGQGLIERRILIEDLQYMLLGYESLLLCHERQYFFFLFVVVFQECRLPLCELYI